MISCLVIDDEPLAVRLIEDHINKTHDLHCAGSFTKPIEALHFLEKEKVDLLFLDIQMPELTGIQFLKIAAGKYPVIMTTAYVDYALNGYDLDVIDFLIKPINYERFYKSVEKARRRMSKAGTKDSGTLKEYIFIKSEYKTLKIDLESILYIEGLSDYIAIHTKDGQKLLTLDSLKNFEKKLPEIKFIRIHKSYIISLDQIDFIERQRVVINGKYLPIGSTYQKEFWSRLG